MGEMIRAWEAHPVAGWVVFVMLWTAACMFAVSISERRKP